VNRLSGRRWLAALLVGIAAPACLVACRKPAPAVQPPAPVALHAYLYVDADLVARFGAKDGRGGAEAASWLREANRQMSAQFPLTITCAGVGSWRLPSGALDGKAIFEKYVPHNWPQNSGADCLIALTGRKGVYWSGISQWPRIFLKAQAAEPVDEKTVALLCHEISHWFGTVDIIDVAFPERSVMNYKDKRFGMVDGRVVWDRGNRDRMLLGIAQWRHEEGPVD
jgi:hypothetical protein